MRRRLLASGSGWSVSDVVCKAGPADRPFEERHRHFCIAAVTEGTFQYRSARGTAVLAPGALLLGVHGSSFECGHEHAAGDRCLSFGFAPDQFERLVSDVEGARSASFPAPRLPPLDCLLPLLAAAEAARDRNDAQELEELVFRLAGAVVRILNDARRPSRSPTFKDERRITRALRRIEARAEERLTLSRLADEAGMSPYHFLRSFRQIVGMTPHQFVLRARMHRAAVRLRRSGDAVSAVAFAAGFNDLSTFNRRFKRVAGVSPTAFRVGAHYAPA
jgi:AraC family transcriptional regulator